MSQKNENPTQFVYKPDGNAGGFVMVLAREDELTVDGRIFNEGAIKWRNPPLPLLFKSDNTEAAGHAESYTVATIADVWRDGKTIYGRGYFGSDERSQAARTMIDEGLISGVSADVGGVTAEEFAEVGEDGVRKRIHEGTIIGVTALPMASFNDTRISVTAAAVPNGWEPPAEWFEAPKFTKPTPLSVTADGRVSGHAAVWGTCHIGYKDRCVSPPRSPSNYQYFNTGTVIAAGGKQVSVGRLTAAIGHAGPTDTAQMAVQHYDHSDWQAAYIHASEDEFGIVFAGAVAPGTTSEQLAVLRAGAVSGDWRKIGSGLEMVGLLAVNTPGFPIPKTSMGMVAGAQMSLTAAGFIVEEDCGCDELTGEDVSPHVRTAEFMGDHEGDHEEDETDEQIAARHIAAAKAEIAAKKKGTSMENKKEEEEEDRSEEYVIEPTEKIEEALSAEMKVRLSDLAMNDMLMESFHGGKHNEKSHGNWSGARKAVKSATGKGAKASSSSAKKASSSSDKKASSSSDKKASSSSDKKASGDFSTKKAQAAEVNVAIDSTKKFLSNSDLPARKVAQINGHLAKAGVLARAGKIGKSLDKIDDALFAFPTAKGKSPAPQVNGRLNKMRDAVGSDGNSGF